MRWLLLLPPLAVLYPPLYAHVHPTLGSVPFFVWYQVAIVVVEALLTAAVFRYERRP